MVDTILGQDLKVDEDGDILFDSNNEFVIVSGNDNLVQAIVNRLKTGVGDLELHSLYGSRIPLVVGENNKKLVLPTIRQVVKEALLQEPRIERIKQVLASFVSNNEITVSISVVPLNATEPLNIIYPIFLS